LSLLQAHLNRQYENPLFSGRYAHTYAPAQQLQQQRHHLRAAAQGNGYAQQQQWRSPVRSPSSLPSHDAMRVLHAQDQVRDATVLAFA